MKEQDKKRLINEPSVELSEKLEAGDAQIIAAALGGNQNLVLLKLPEGKIDLEDAKAIAAALAQNTFLTTLDLSHVEIGVEGIEAIAEGLVKNKTLTTLILASKHDNTAAKGQIDGLLTLNRKLFIENISKKNALAVQHLKKEIEDLEKSNPGDPKLLMLREDLKVISRFEDSFQTLQSGNYVKSVQIVSEGGKIKPVDQRATADQNIKPGEELITSTVHSKKIDN